MGNYAAYIKDCREYHHFTESDTAVTYQTNRFMSCEEITQHLNKVATLYLKDNKRKVGWIFVEEAPEEEVTIENIYFLSIQKGRKLISAMETGDMKSLEPFSERISVDEIERIRSTK